LFYQFLSYLKFLLKSTSQYDVHSPFVYDFITKCLYKKDKSSNHINAFIKSLLANKNIIEVTDFGAGSRVFKSNKRSISDIAKKAGISIKRGELLYILTQYFKPKHILEIGTSLGLATANLSYANTNAKITTLEGCTETAKIAQMQFDNFDINNVKIVLGDFKNTLPEIIKDQKYDLIYFDGNHQKEATINYFNQCLSSINNNTVFIFDDIHWSKEMEKAWNYIIDHKKVTISMDTYQWGIVFFRKEQHKEHFVIRV